MAALTNYESTRRWRSVNYLQSGAGIINIAGCEEFITVEFLAFSYVQALATQTLDLCIYLLLTGMTEQLLLAASGRPSFEHSPQL